jgi:MFS family permease
MDEKRKDASAASRLGSAGFNRADLQGAPLGSPTGIRKGYDVIRTISRNTALQFVLIIGVVNLFADFTYEGGRSIMGPFLGVLGASAAAVGAVAGLGEFAGYALRSVSGYLADRTRGYWAAAFIGYAVNMLAVPALALAGSWPAAAALIVAERTGRAIRRPSVETMLSRTGGKMGVGWAFGLNEALDQAGATVGPLVVALVLYLKGGYREGFAVLLVTALLCLVTLAIARMLYPRAPEVEPRAAVLPSARGFSRAYWIYVAAGALTAAGFAHFTLIAFHFQQTGSVPANAGPVLYAAAMAMGALAALVLGRLYDRAGLAVLLLAFFLAAFAAPLVFLGGFASAFLGMLLWGIGIGAQDSLLKAVLTGVSPEGRRSTAFGVFDTGFGFAWFFGSTAMGLLYGVSIPALAVFSVAVQLAALPVFLAAGKRS